jgi:RNA polymerase sigma-70 factor (ECF subfamily)
VTVARASIEDVFRAEHAKIYAALVKQFGDFALAGDALQEAFVGALERWPEAGVPERPGAWIMTAARNAATSVRRHDAVVQKKSAEIDVPRAQELDGDDVPDERLRLVFACCHPALAVESRIALTLHAMAGLDVDAIARLLLAEPSAIAQRLVRAKKKIAEAGIPFEIPAAEQLDERIAGVLAVVYLLFTEGYDPTSGDDVVRAPLCEEAIRLGRVLCHLMPLDPETRGLLALMCLHHARIRARASEDGTPIALEDQDRSRWNADAIADASLMLDEALSRNAPGPYQIQAAIAALHATAPSWADTDFVQIALLYRELFARVPSPAVGIGLAIAEGLAHGSDAGLARLDALAEAGLFESGGRVLAARADLLRRAGRTAEATSAYRAAIESARNPREAAFLTRRLALL